MKTEEQKRIEKLEADLEKLGNAARRLIDADVAGTVNEQFKRRAALVMILDDLGVPR